MRHTRGDENEGGARGGESASPKGGRAGQREEKVELAHVGTALRTPRPPFSQLSAAMASGHRNYVDRTPAKMMEEGDE